MTDIQIFSAIGATVGPLLISQFILYYRIGRIDQKVADRVNGHIGKMVREVVKDCLGKAGFDLDETINVMMGEEDEDSPR